MQQAQTIKRPAELLHWLIVISVRQFKSLRTCSHVSRSLPMSQLESRIELHSASHLHKRVTYTVHEILTFITRLISFCLQSLHHRFVDWTTPSAPSLMLGTVTDLARSKSELVAENALLRQQLIILRRQVKRPTCAKTDRLILVLFARASRACKHAHITCPTRDAPAVASAGMRACSGSTSPEQHLPNQRYPQQPWL